MIIVYYGKPRSGKTTVLASYVARNESKKRILAKFPFLKFLVKPYSVIYSTDPSIKGTVPVQYKYLGQWLPEEHSLLILAEAGIGLNNRNWKSLSADCKELLAMHGHRKMDIIADSQTVDMDVALRSRSEKYFSVRKLWWCSQFSIIIPIKFDIDVNDTTRKVEECYSRGRGLRLFFSVLLGITKIMYRKPYYKYFDSYAWDKKFPLSKPL